jgi:hypothetical protein
MKLLFTIIKGRIMRALVSQHVFREVDEGRFANNHISRVLVGDVPFQSLIIMKCV